MYQCSYLQCFLYHSIMLAPTMILVIIHVHLYQLYKFNINFSSTHKSYMQPCPSLLSIKPHNIISYHKINDVGTTIFYPTQVALTQESTHKGQFYTHKVLPLYHRRPRVYPNTFISYIIIGGPTLFVSYNTCTTTFFDSYITGRSNLSECNFVHTKKKYI